MTENRITEDRIDTLMAEATIEDMKIGDKSTVVNVVLPNGFNIIDSSSCVDPENYDHELGKSICLKRIREQVWHLEGYRLQCELADQNTQKEAANG